MSGAITAPSARRRVQPASKITRQKTSTAPLSKRYSHFASYCAIEISGMPTGRGLPPVVGERLHWRRNVRVDPS
eukprot:SAG11_NODE_36184_length_263_cov_0.597561_1_plen_73_part_01